MNNNKDYRYQNKEEHKKRIGKINLKFIDKEVKESIKEERKSIKRLLFFV